MKTNKFAMGAVSATCAAMLFTGAAFAQQPAQPPARVDASVGASARAVTLTATVAAIDLKNRVITLKGQQGNEFLGGEGLHRGADVNQGVERSGHRKIPE